MVCAMLLLRLLALSLLLLPLPGFAQVRASLVAAERAIQPGRPVQLALRLEHSPGWHTYWLNPGTGLPTTLTWQLPEGFRVGAPHWPAPQVVHDAAGNVTGNGYEGDLLVPVEVTTPATLAPGPAITLRVKVEWLMCRENCRPASSELTLTLPVVASLPEPDPLWQTRLATTVARLPADLPADAVRATLQPRAVRLSVALAAVPEAARGALHFFADDNLIAYDQPQTVQPDGKDRLALILPLTVDAPRMPARLSGVLTAGPVSGRGEELLGWRVEVPITAPAAEAPGRRGGFGGWLATLALAFLGGAVLNLMPCVFPVLGIKILGFVQQAGADRRKVVAHGLAFTGGVLASFWVLAGVLLALRAGGGQLGWGFQLQSPAFVYALAAGLLIFGLNLSGVFEVGLGATGVGASWQSRSGLAGSFFTGVLATVVATPCSAPFLATALGAALTLPPGPALAVFTAIALGLAAPYLLLAIFPAAVRALPRPGAWMETLKQAMAFPLYATAGFLVWVLAGQVDEYALRDALFGLVLLAAGAWAYGRAQAARRPRLAWAWGLAGVALGGWLGWPPAPTGELAWEPWSAERVAQLRAEQRWVYVDFTARWCATCQTNKQLVFGSAEVRRRFREHQVVLLRADWTRRDAAISAELARWGRSAVPFNLVYRPDRPEPVVLPDLLTAGTVLDAVR